MKNSITYFTNATADRFATIVTLDSGTLAASNFQVGEESVMLGGKEQEAVFAEHAKNMEQVLIFPETIIVPKKREQPVKSVEIFTEKGAQITAKVAANSKK